ncbi:MAG: helix-turn-helix transcriptional regulator [Lachnospiraceae bacterium]|nr:helix-turn-helix transcriptional regulator [Lachnospiraceae bacterium]
MEIGKKLKKARMEAGLTQEKVAEEILVSRQTISNWENEKSYPDIMSVIRLSDLYQVSLDQLLKGDEQMLEHLEESTNIVSSNKKLILITTVNLFVLILLMIFASRMPQNLFALMAVFILAIISSAALLYQIIKKI